MSSLDKTPQVDKQELNSIDFNSLQLTEEQLLSLSKQLNKTKSNLTVTSGGKVKGSTEDLFNISSILTDNNNNKVGIIFMVNGKENRVNFNENESSKTLLTEKLIQEYKDNATTGLDYKELESITLTMETEKNKIIDNVKNELQNQILKGIVEQFPADGEFQSETFFNGIEFDTDGSLAGAVWDTYAISAKSIKILTDTLGLSQEQIIKKLNDLKIGSSESVAPASIPVAPASTPVVPASTPVAPGSTPVAPAISNTNETIHKVESGDTLWEIVKNKYPKYQDQPAKISKIINAVVDYNKDKKNLDIDNNPKLGDGIKGDVLYIGQEIKLPSLDKLGTLQKIKHTIVVEKSKNKKIDKSNISGSQVKKEIETIETTEEKNLKELITKIANNTQDSVNLKSIKLNDGATDGNITLERKNYRNRRGNIEHKFIVRLGDMKKVIKVDDTGVNPDDIKKAMTQLEKSEKEKFTGNIDNDAYTDVYKKLGETKGKQKIGTYINKNGEIQDILLSDNRGENQKIELDNSYTWSDIDMKIPDINSQKDLEIAKNKILKIYKTEII